MTPEPDLRVLMSFPQPKRTSNPFLSELLGSLPPHVRAACFSWRAALLGRYDVLHLHWPENFLRGKDPVRRTLRRVMLMALLARLGVNRKGVVRTVHNVRPHEVPGRLDSLLLLWCDRRTDVWVRLNRHTPTPDPAHSITIVHGHYVDWFAGHVPEDTLPGRLSYVGLLRPYKGVESLVTAFAGSSDPGLSLHVAGNPTTDELADVVRTAAAVDPRVSASLAYIDDAELVQVVTASELVVLPYKEMHNSGAALLALSLRRPVLVPESAVNTDLAAEVGAGWVQTFAGELTATTLAAAIDGVRSGSRSAAPDLSKRAWADLGHAYAAAYAAAASRRAARSRRT